MDRINEINRLNSEILRLETVRECLGIVTFLSISVISFILLAL
jgi:hypothetical protein